MTGKELIAKLKDDMFQNYLLDEEVCLRDILDCLACLGVEGASEAYMTEMIKIAEEMTGTRLTEARSELGLL